MRTLSSALSTETAKSAGGSFRWLVHIAAMGAGTRYLASDERTISSTAYAGELIDLSPLYETPGALSDLTVEILDNAANREVLRTGAVVDVLLWPVGGAIGDADTLFHGEISGPISFGGGSLRCDCVSYARRHDRLIGTPLSVDDYPDADPDDVGKILPEIYGTHPERPCLAIAAGWLTTLTAEISASATSIELTDTSGLGGTGTVQIDAEQITYTGKTGDTLTGCTRGANGTTAEPHAQGAQLAEVQTEYDYLIARHAIKQAWPVYVDGVRLVAEASNDLNGAITDSATSIALTDASDFPAKGTVIIESEHIHYTGVSTHTLTGCTRGVNGTTAAAHADATAVDGWALQVLTDESGLAKLRFFTRATVTRQVALGINDPLPVTSTNVETTTASKSTAQNTTTASGTLTVNASGDCINWITGTKTFSFTSLGTLTSQQVEALVSHVSVTFSTCSISTGQAEVYLERTSGAESHLIGTFTFANKWQWFIGPVAFVNSENSFRIRLRMKSINQTVIQFYDASRTAYQTGVVTVTTTSNKDTAATLVGNSTADTVIGGAVTVDMSGHLDDGSGTITGTADALIERPDHVVRHLLRTYAGASAAETAAGDFDAFTGDELAIALDAQIQVRDLLESIDGQARALTLYSGDRWRMVARPDSAPTPDLTLTDSEVVRDEDGASSIHEGRAGLDRIANRFPWRAGLAADGTWAHSGVVDALWSQTAFGIREQAINLPYVFDSIQALALVQWAADRESTPVRRQITVSATLKSYEAEIGDIVRVNHTALGLDVTGELLSIGPRLLYGRGNGMMQMTIEEAIAPAVEAVAWTAGVNVTATGNDLQRTTGGAAWNAGAVSDKAIQSGDGWMSSTLADVSGDQAFGLSNGDTNQARADIDFAWVVLGATAYVYEGGTLKSTYGTVVAGDVLYVSVVGGEVRYYRNAELAYTSLAAPTYPLLVDTSIYTASETIDDVYISGTLA